MAHSYVLDVLAPIESILDRYFDDLVSRPLNRVVSWMPPSPVRKATADVRSDLLERVFSQYEPRCLELLERIDKAPHGEKDSLQNTYDQTLENALTCLRASTSPTANPFAKLGLLLDRYVRANREEWLDDPNFDRDLRIRVLDRLHKLNESLGNYDRFAETITQLLAQVPRSESAIRIVDLASGHGMFAVELAARLQSDARIQVTATDRMTEYLSLGQALAKMRAVDEKRMTFCEQDVFALDELPAKIGGPAHILLCTQTLHHFSPGFVARLLVSATRAAKVGVLCIDGDRSFLALLTMPFLSLMIARSHVPFWHDSIVSTRRFYNEQELLLLAKLAPFSEEERKKLFVNSGWFKPSYAWLHTALPRENMSKS